MQETVYQEFSSARWSYWTYADGVRVTISQRQFDLMVRQGAKVVVVGRAMTDPELEHLVAGLERLSQIINPD